MKIETLLPSYKVDSHLKEEIIHFLHLHLDQFGDSISDISKCIDYALRTENQSGGIILIAREEKQMIGAAVINHTGMSGYIPENILVYLAIHREYRGKGLGSQLMQEIFQQTNGDIALHVEPDNPARKLYEKLGFTNKYLEMRWKRP